MKKNEILNGIKMAVFTALLGITAGIVIWVFLKAVSICTELLWKGIPAGSGSLYIMIPVCAAGGLAVGMLRKRFGDYPEDLQTVMAKVKKNKHYEYRPMLVILVCAFLPLVLGASVGPEAGLTGIIAALCYWVGDNVTYARKHTEEFSRIGEAVTLSQLFHAPLFGIFAVEEDSAPDADGAGIPKIQKLVLYGISTASAFLTTELLNSLFGKAMAGFPSFSEITAGVQDYLMLFIYIPVGILLYLVFELCETLTKEAARRVPAVLKETICGAVIGIAALLMPLILFSGEEPMGELMNTFGSYAPWFLIGLCLLKILMTAFCIRFGLKGGHFFPLIFACTCMGFGIAALVFAEPSEHVVYAAGIITAVTLGAQLKKPLAVAFLMLLCFPLRFLLWAVLAAAIGSFFGKKLLKSKTE